MKKVLEFLNKKIVIFRWQLNLLTTFVLFLGIILGGYLGVSKMVHIFALNDTYQTWDINTANISSYTYDNTMASIDNSGAKGGLNKVLNQGFEDSLNNWNGANGFILRDEFSDTLPLLVANDTFTRSDGAIGNAETGGAWTGSTWLVAGNRAMNVPTLGSELWKTGASTFDSGTYTWVAYGTNTMVNDSGSLKVSFADSQNGAYSYFRSNFDLTSNLTAGQWYKLTFDSKVSTGNNVTINLSDSVNGYSVAYETSTTFVTHTAYFLAKSASTCYMNFVGMSAGESIWLDNMSLKPINTPPLFASIVYSGSSDLTVQSDVTLGSYGFPAAGVVMNLDSTSNPQNYVVAYHDGTYAHLDKYVGGVYTSLINTATTYVSGATIKVIKNGTSYTLFYNGSLVGTTQTISDAGIINNTKYGLFSSSSDSVLDNFKIYKGISGTSATVAGGARTTIDTQGIMNIGSGKLNVTGGRVSPNWNDPQLSYPTVARSSGKLLTAKINKANLGAGGMDVGFTGNYLRYGLDVAIDGGVNATVASTNNSTDYNIAVVLRSTGAYYYAKGGQFSNWTLLWVGQSSNIANPNPYINNYNSVFTVDNFGIPNTSWLPAPLAYDSFTRANGAIGNSETNGPDSQTTPQLAWTGGSISANKLVITPAGNEEITNGNMEAGNPPSNWTTGNGATISSVGDERTGGSGSKSLSLVNPNDLNNGKVQQNISTSVGQWYLLTGYARAVTQSAIVRIADRALHNTNQSYTNTIASTSWSPIINSGRMAYTNQAFIGVMSSGALLESRYDDISLKSLTLSSLFATVPSSTSDVIISADVTLTSGTQAGIVTNLDSTSNPQNFIIGYNNGTVFYLDKSVNGTYTNLFNATVNSTNGSVRIITYHSDANTLKVRVYYNNSLVGVEQTVTDASIINNTTHGLFSTYSGNTFDNFSLFARGSNGEYNGIPAEDLTVTADTGTKRTGASSAKLVAGGNDANFVQNINVGDTSGYTMYAYAYTNGSAVTSNDLQLYYNGTALNTTYTNTTGNWYRLKATFTGIASSKEVGVRVKAGKTVYVDDILVTKTTTGTPVFTTAAYSNILTNTYDSFAEISTKPNSSNIKYVLCADDGSTCESGNTWQYYNGSAWTTSTGVAQSNTVSELTQSVMQTFPVSSKKVSVKAYLIPDEDTFPTLSQVKIGLTTDTTRPTNASDAVLRKTPSITCNNSDNCWTSSNTPRFEWSSGSDSESGLKGYCVYLGTDTNADPATNKGKLGTSPAPLSYTTCGYITSNNYLDFSLADTLASNLSNTDTFITADATYYVKIKAIDNAGNTSLNSEVLTFRYDKVPPINVGFISTTAGNFSNVADMSFSWPSTGSGISSDTLSQVLGWQYQINGTDGTWKGTTHSDELNIDYIPFGTYSYNLTSGQDGSSIVTGNNVIYFRTVDTSGNYSTDATIRTGNLSFGGQAPVFNGSDKVTINPASSTNNSFSLSWPQATATVGKNVTHYYYMINTQPPMTLTTLQGNNSAYIDNGTSTSVSSTSLPNVNKGTNTVYVVAVDNSNNYSPSNYITGTFTLNSTNPDNVNNLVASDSSIKSQSKWNVTLSWTEPDYKGAGNLTYQVYRSTDSTNYTLVGSSTGLSYVDNTPSSTLYYYKIVTKDGSDSLSSGTNAVSITPTGRWTTAPLIDTEPEVLGITTKRATIRWSTQRTADSKVSFGTKSGVYGVEEPSNPTQTTNHEINLVGLVPNTQYYYVAKWTDEDGNTGTSQEYSFRTAPAPVIKNVVVSSVSLNNAIIQFTVKGATKIKLYYGETTNYGGVKEVSTATTETTYTLDLSGLKDGTKYFFKINPIDGESGEYDGTVLDFTTLPKPKISNIKLQEVMGTAQTTILVTWESNTGISSIVTYYPQGVPTLARDEVSVSLVKGEHRMIIRGLLPQTIYTLQVKGRDRIGNEALGETQKFTTSTDSRAPQLSNQNIEGTITQASTTSQEGIAQLIISWDTDEPATSQVEFGEGSEGVYTQKSQEDSNLTYNHIVVLSNLSPSKVYHLRAISKDKVSNEGKTVDTVTITPKSTDNAFNLVISNLQEIFGFLK